MTYSIDAARAQRMEATGPAWEFEFGGETFTMPREYPVELLTMIAEIDDIDLSAMMRLLELLLGEEQAARLGLARLSAEDIVGLIEAYGDEVGIPLGESKRSANSSPSTPKPSKPTSKRSTGSTSRNTTAARSARGASKR